MYDRLMKITDFEMIIYIYIYTKRQAELHSLKPILNILLDI